MKSSCFELFRDGKYGLFWAKKLMERWHLLATERFLFWSFRWWQIRPFFQAKSWWKDDIYLVFFSFPWYSRTWKIWFFVQCFVCRMWSVYLSVSILSAPVLARKIPSCGSVTLILTFHPNFDCNSWVFTNSPIYRKLINENISLVFWTPRIFCLVLFSRRYKIVCTYEYLR